MSTVLNKLVYLANQAESSVSQDDSNDLWRQVLDFAEETPIVFREPLTPYILAYAFYKLVKVEPDALLKAKAYIHLAVTLNDFDELVIFRPLETIDDNLMKKIIELKRKLYSPLLENV